MRPCERSRCRSVSGRVSARVCSFLCAVTGLRVGFSPAFTATVTNMHFLCYWFVQFCASGYVGGKQSRVVSRRGCCLSPRGSVIPAGCLPEGPSSGAGTQTSPPDQSSLFLTWHVCCSRLVAVLQEGQPARLPLHCPVGVRVQPQPGPALLAPWVSPEELNSFLRLHKMFKVRKETFRVFG